jgi:transposase
LDAANHHEITLANPALSTIKVPQQRGRPKARPKELVADKAYDSRESRHTLCRRGIKPTIPTFKRCRRKKPKRGRPAQVGQTCQQRWQVERCFSWVDNCRRLVVRYDRHLHIYRSFCLIAIIMVHRPNFEIGSREKPS